MVSGSGEESSQFLGLPSREWYAAALSQQVTRAPRRVDVLGRHFVLYRSVEGVPVAHLDRCPHRNVPLSLGRCLKDDTIECAYHGWKFAPDGGCVQIPGLSSPVRKGQRVETFAVTEKYGIVWLCPDEEGRKPHHDVLPIAEADGTGYTVVTRHAPFPGGLFAVVENALDVPHTAVLHRGLFRGGARQSVDVVLRRYSEWAEAEYIGETPPSGLVAKLLSWGGRGDALTVQHWDRFILPSVLQVEYRMGERTHFLISGFCTPHSESQTSVFAVVCIKTPLFQFLEKIMVRLIEPFAMRVVAQDVQMLKAQAETMERCGGERFMSTEIDVLSNSIRRLLKESTEVSTRDDPTSRLVALPRPRGVNRNEVPREVTDLKILA